MIALKTRFDWRALVVLGLVLNLGAYLLIPEWLGVSRQKILHFAGVAALEFPFMDLRGVATWCEAAANGVDPAATHTKITLPDGTHQLNFLMNYSPVVLWFHAMGLRPSTVSIWALGLALLQLASLWGLCGKLRFRDAVVWLLLVCSPASMMLIERANMDILVFACFVLALVLRGHAWAAVLPILLAAALKFYPAAGLAAPWSRGGWHQRLASAAGLLLFLAFLFLLKSQLAAIGASLSGQYQSAFGSTVVADLLKNHGILSEPAAIFLSQALQISALGLGFLGCGLGFFLSRKWPTPMEDRASYAFWLAAPMFLVLFVLSNQMDYKWAFLLFMVPAVLGIAQGGVPFWSICAKAWLVSVCVYSYWTFFSGEESLRNAIFKQGVMWVVFLLGSLLTGCLLARMAGFLNRVRQV